MEFTTRLTARQVWANAGVTPVRTSMPRVVTPWNVDRDAHGRIEICDIGRVRLVRIRVVHALRVEQVKDSPQAREPATYKLLLLISGRTTLQQGGREVTLGAGDWVAYRGAEPYVLENLERCEQRMVVLPESELPPSLTEIDLLLMRRFGGNDRSSKQLVALLDSAFDIAAIYGPNAAAQLAGAAVHLARIALLENAGPQEQSALSDVMRGRVKNFIDRNLRDPDLSLGGIASALNCSKRYLHKVFAHDEESVAGYILNQRLERCFVELTHSDGAKDSIAQLAYGWGFKSLSHFSKAFTRRYGVTPGERRRASLKTASTVR